MGQIRLLRVKKTPEKYCLLHSHIKNSLKLQQLHEAKERSSKGQSGSHVSEVEIAKH